MCVHIQVTVIAVTDGIMKPAAQMALFSPGRKTNQLRNFLSPFKLSLFKCESFCASECLGLFLYHHGRNLAGARRRPGARRGGAEPCSPPGRGGARTRERVADPGQRVLTQPDPEDISRAKCGEEQNTWDFCFEASSVKNVTTIAIKFLAIKLSKESLTFRDFRKKAGKDGSTLLSFICKSLNSGTTSAVSPTPWPVRLVKKKLTGSYSHCSVISLY